MRAHQEAVRDSIIALRKLGQHVERQPLGEAQDRAQDEAADGACATVLLRIRLRSIQCQRGLSVCSLLQRRDTDALPN